MDEALALGAVACVIKPALDAGTGDWLELLGEELAAKIMQCCPEQPCFTVIEAGADRRGAAAAMATAPRSASTCSRLRVSTGGPSALMDLIPRFPKDFPVPIVIVQHMPPTFTKLLAERLAAKSSIRVVEGRLHQALAPGCASIAPGDFHMAVGRDGEERPDSAPSGAAGEFLPAGGRRAVPIGRPGLRPSCARGRDDGHGTGRVHRMRAHPCRRRPGHRPGRRELRRLGHAGLRRQGRDGRSDPSADRIGPEIIRKVWNHRRKAVVPAVTPGPCAAAGEARAAMTKVTAGEFNYIRDLVREHSALLLEPGKEYLVESRLEPLARQEGFPSFQGLVENLRAVPFCDLHRRVAEAMTNNETTFFRDVRMFAMLRHTMVPELVARRSAQRSLNIWSAACSSGQEPYSVAMLLRDHLPALDGWNLGLTGERHLAGR